jgi:hypothetical protein
MNGYGAVPEYDELESYMYRDKRSTMNLIGKIDSFPELGNTIVIGGKIYVKKQEPLGERIEVPSGNTDYVFGFCDGVLYAEKEHGIGE